ncbi:MAG TPA: UPF0175 family protein [Candidatus Nanoarchaeia archaeon]|nr:UPF0175 family protein [Candidatus Nanoarchaeia archaeon]
MFPVRKGGGPSECSTYPGLLDLPIINAREGILENAVQSSSIFQYLEQEWNDGVKKWLSPFSRLYRFSVKVNESEMSDFIKRTLAIELYREGKLSLGKAAELAGARNKWEMLTLLDKNGVPLNYNIKDIEEDLDILERIIG